MKHFVLIDDDPDEIEILAAALDGLPFKSSCIFAHMPGDAMMVLNTLNPDVILVDYNMPGINGLECIKMIRRCSRFIHTCIVLYSNGASDNLNHQAISIGANFCIAKSDTIARLRAEILRITEQLPIWA